MNAFFVTTEDDTLQIGPTRVGRASAAIERFVFLAPVVAIIGAIFFLPDYVGRYQEQEPVPGLLAGVLAIFSVFVGLVAGVMRFLRGELWVLDAGERALIYQTNRVIGTGVQQAAIDLDQIERVWVEVKDTPRTSGMYLSIVDGPQRERMLDTRFGAEALDEVAEQLEAFADDHGLALDVETAMLDE